MPGRGLWSAGGQATRAMVHAAAQEEREHGIHVALLIVDATIESPKTASFTRDAPPELARRPAPDRRGGGVPGRAGAARLYARADAHARRRSLGALILAVGLILPG